MTDRSRLVELRGCVNFRDLGGYSTADGRVTRWGRLFRADGLTHLSVDDMETLGQLGIRNVIDLRTELEVESRGRFHGDHKGMSYCHLPLTDTLPGAEQSPEWGDTDFVAQRYFAMVTGGAPVLRQALELVSQPDQTPLVFHCSVGKDRTGVLSAVILGLLEVPEETIVADYVLSAEPMVRLLERFRSEYPDSHEVVEQFAPVILSVQPRSMAGFLALVKSSYGSFNALVEDAGVPGDLIDRLRHHLLTDP